jgi:hypothetical protein
MHDNSIPSSQHKQELYMDIFIRPPIVINLDDVIEIAKIYDEVHNELNSLFSSSMSLNDESPNNSVELGACPSLALHVVPLASYPDSTYID